MPLIQWTTVRLVVSENDGRPSRQRNKTHKGEETYLHFARGDETKLLGLRKTTRPNSRGLNAETRMAGIEPMGEISLLTFLFIGLPDCRLSCAKGSKGIRHQYPFVFSNFPQKISLAINGRMTVSCEVNTHAIDSGVKDRSKGDGRIETTEKPSDSLIRSRRDFSPCHANAGSISRTFCPGFYGFEFTQGKNRFCNHDGKQKLDRE